MNAAVAETRSVPAGLRLRILAPDDPSLSDADLRRLFRRRGITRRRRARMRRLPMVVAVHGGQLVGLAAYEPSGDDLRVHELACGADLSFTSTAVLTQLLECLELAAVAGGASRIVVLPWAIPNGAGLDRLGYRWTGLGRRGLEKRLF